MNAIARKVLCLVACLALNGTAEEQENSAASGAGDNAPPSTPSMTANQAVAYDLFTNIVGRLSDFGISVHVENLTLNLNGFAMVGLANSMTAPTARQTIAHAELRGDSSLLTDNSPSVMQKVSEIELRDGVVRVGNGDTNLLVISNSNLLSLATNLLGTTAPNGLRLRVGRLSLNLNGYALVGITNFFESPTAEQLITNAPVRGRKQRTLDGAGIIRSSPFTLHGDAASGAAPIEIPEVVVELNGLTVFDLPSDWANPQQPAGSSTAR